MSTRDRLTVALAVAGGLLLVIAAGLVAVPLGLAVAGVEALSAAYGLAYMAARKAREAANATT